MLRVWEVVDRYQIVSYEVEDNCLRDLYNHRHYWMEHKCGMDLDRKKRVYNRYIYLHDQFDLVN